ncbi:methylated-DNA--[bacterium]|nr:methylated-DNA--[protein]-cysteine S-methyltransferase [bacterium]
MDISFYKSPIGNLEIICNNNELISLKMVDKIELSNDETGFIKNIKSQLDEYFSQKRKNFDININPNGTEFQKRVWRELQNIPYGKTKSYSEIANIIGQKNAQRAVGNACNKNPIMIIIPCHRVIAKNGNVNGFAYGKNVKEKLLELEYFLCKYLT